jgi:hypothetical protein
MIACPRFTEQQHRAILASKPPISLIRKVCSCGTVVKAKELIQFGGCQQCWRTTK